MNPKLPSYARKRNLGAKMPTWKLVLWTVGTLALLALAAFMKHWQGGAW